MVTLENKDIIALVLIVLSFVGLYLDKLPLHVFTSIIFTIIGFYFGIKIERLRMKGR